MEIQKSKILGDLYYDNTTPQYVPPPVAERKALTAQKEADYLLNVQQMNSLDAVKRNLPKEYSPEVYNKIMNTIDESLAGVNADNYSDKVLDVAQLSNDVVNKLGGNELLQQKEQIGQISTHFDTALKEGKIADPDMANWYKQKSLQAVKPLSYDERGFVTKPNAKPVDFAEYQDMQKLLDERMKGWAEDGTFKRNADGTVTLLKNIPGYLGYTKGKSISEKELLEAGMNYLKNDAKVQAYLNDKAEFDLRNVPADGQTLAEVLTPQMKEILTGNSEADAMDIQLAISQGKFNPQQVLNELQKQKIILDNSKFTAAKYGFTQEELVTLEDKMLMEAIRRTDANAKAAAAAKAGDTAIVTLEPFTTQQILSPADINKIKANKADLIEKRKTLQVEINQYQKALNAGTKGYTVEQIELKNQQQAKLDNDIAELEYQENSVKQIMVDNGKKVGVDFEKEYDANLGAFEKETNQYNSTAIIKTIEQTGGQSRQLIKLDVTDTLKKDAKGNYTIKTWDGKTNVIPKELVEESGGKAYLKAGSTAFAPTFNKILQEEVGEVVGANGKLTNKLIAPKEVKDKLEAQIVRTPDKKEYLGLVVDMYNNGESSTGLLGNDKPYIDSDTRAYIPSTLIKKVEEVRDKIGEIDFEVAQPLSYLLVTGDTTKSHLRVYQNKEKANNTSLKNNAAQYQVNTPTQKFELGEYLKETYGVPDLSDTYIDWSKSSVKTLTQTDREYGQKYGMNIVLTAEGKKELNDAGNEAFKRDSTLKIVTVNPSKDTAGESAAIQDILLEAYPDIQNKDTENGLRLKQEMGLLYLNHSPEGKALDKMNLYTLPAGEMKTWTVRGTDYNVISTTRDATQSDLMNVDFHLTKAEGNVQKVFAVDSKGNKAWMPLKEVEESKGWSKVIFESPSDIKASVGGTLLDADVKSKQGSTTPQSNAALDYLKQMGYFNNGSNQTAVTNYNKVVSSVQSYYGNTPQTIALTNYTTGKEVQISARVPANDLVDLSGSYKSRIAPNTSYPYINKEAVNYVDNILTDFGVTITGGFRGEVTHFGLKESSKNSLHKYGFALDFRADAIGEEFYNEVSTNPDLLQKYGIVSILKHGDPLHVHVEFNPSLV